MKFLLLMTLALNSFCSASFDATIPVVDLNDFYHPETKQKFVEEVAQALHEVGFFGVINTGVDVASLEAAYRTSEQFFSSPMEWKDQICDPSLNGQRGFVHSEVAQGFKTKDFKEFVHIGQENNLWPTWMDLQTPIEHLRDLLDEKGKVLQQAFALAIGEEEDFFVRMTENGHSLMRLLYYPPNPEPGRLWAAKHTDIDLFTILPISTEEGLQVFYQGKWIDVKVPENAFIVNGGDMLQNITNGYFKSSLHQVMAKPNLERYSIVYFLHPKDNDSLSPRAQSIAITGGVQCYPDATRLELLSVRLRELKLATAELMQFERDSHIMDRIRDLVEKGIAADPVKETYEIWKTGG